MQFEVNGQDYFLNFAEDEAYWYVLAPTLTGVQRIPVYVDSPAYERFGILGRTGTIFRTEVSRPQTLSSDKQEWPQPKKRLLRDPRREEVRLGGRYPQGIS